MGDRIDSIIGFLRRRYLVILIPTLLSLPVGAWYLFTSPATYTASTVMMIDTARKSPLGPQSDFTPDSGWVDSQIGILRSVNVAAYVAKQLGLANDPKFVATGPGWFDNLRARFGWKAPEPSSDAERAARATGKVLAGLGAQRIGLSYMIRIDYRSEDPAIAVKIANAMVDGYVFDQMNAKYLANRRAGDWLQERLQALREQAATAERAVVEFKAKNNIVAVPGGLINEKQLSETTNSLATVRTRAAELQARINRINAVRPSYRQDRPASATEEIVSEAMSSGIITNLQTQYLELSNRVADWSVRYGKDHSAVVNLQNQIREIRKSIYEELGRIEESAKSEYEISKKREDELEKALAANISQSQTTNQAQVALFSLEASAKSYRKIYDSFLQQHTETVQAQTYPISEARTLSPAAAYQTGPNALKIWLVTIFAGGAIGIGFGALQEILDRGFRTREQVRAVLETDCLAMVPRLTRNSVEPLPSNWQSSAVRSTRQAGTVFTDALRIAPKRVAHDRSMLWAAIDRPSTPYAEAIRSLKVTVDLNSQGISSVIALTSCFATEGKSTVAAGLATLIAQSGGHVILVDADVRNPSISRAFAPNAKYGFLDVVAGRVALAEAVRRDASTGLDFLPTVLNGDFRNATELLASSEAKSLFSSLKMQYDYVIVDLAPLVAGAGVDTRASARFVDSYMLVIEWGRTRVDAVQYALRHAPEMQGRIVGAVLNKVDLTTIQRYDGYDAHYYYGRSGHPDLVN